MKIKVCGMVDTANIGEAVALGVDFVGLDFRRDSARCVPMTHVGAGTLPDRAPACYANGERKQCRLVGVFADEMSQNIITRTVMFGLDVIQMNGNEPPRLLRNLRATIAPDLRPEVTIWKGISVTSATDVLRYKDYADCADAFVFFVSGGDKPWEVLQAYDGEKPFLIGGDLRPEQAAGLRLFSHPRCMGYDLDAAFETTPGVKDAELIRSFIDTL
jgi:phosphoribosylanthranilate isomerase